jgi:hypothetical protein
MCAVGTLIWAIFNIFICLTTEFGLTKEFMEFYTYPEKMQTCLSDKMNRKNVLAEKLQVPHFFRFFIS